MTSLRIASFVCHTLPDVRLRLRHEGRVLAEVGWDVAPDGERSAKVMRMRPCQLRSAVAQAWQHQRDGRRLGVLGLPEDVDPVIDVGVRGETVQHPGGILTLPYADRWIHAFAVTLGCEETRDAVVRSEPDADASPGGPGATSSARVDLHHDELLGVTLVWTEVSMPVAPHPSSGISSCDLTLEMMRRLLAACAVAEFENELHQLV